MSSTTTDSSFSSHKSDADWLAPVHRFFDALANRPSILAVLVLAFVAIAAGLVSWSNHRDGVSTKANNAMFQAQKALDAEMKALVSATAPAAAPAKGDAKSPAGKKADTTADAEMVMFSRVDVDAKFPEAIKRFSAVTQEFGGTRAGLEAMLALGALYMNHGQGAKAVTWYERAVKAASKPLDRALALAALAAAQESAGKHGEAIQSYEKALQQGEAHLKGDLLLSIARNQELMKDGAKARASYDRVISEMPNSDHARTAEVLKSQVQ